MSNVEYISVPKSALGALEEKALRSYLRNMGVSAVDTVKTERPNAHASKWVKDIFEMHKKYKFHESIEDFDEEKKKVLLDFRVKFLEEELNEIKDNMDNPEEVVDGLIDLCVVAIGTMDLFNINSERAWDGVHVANMSKERGVKPGRPNPLGMPDLMKPEGWEAPSHQGNHGTLPK